MRRVAHEQAQGVFGLSDFALCGGNLRGRGKKQLLSLIDVQRTGRATIVADAYQAQIVVGNFAGLIGDGKFEIFFE